MRTENKTPGSGPLPLPFSPPASPRPPLDWPKVGTDALDLQAAPPPPGKDMAGLLTYGDPTPPPPATPPLDPDVQAALDGKLEGRKGGQCKIFVERQLCAHFSGPVGAKSMVLPGNHPGFELVKEPQPGDIFVMKSQSGWGHTGFVKEAHADGALTVVDSNYKYDERIHTHTYSAATMKSRLLGYLRPTSEEKVAYWVPPVVPLKPKTGKGPTRKV